MKKLVSLFLILALAAMCVGCGSSSAQASSAVAPTAEPEKAPESTSAPEQEPVSASQSEPEKAASEPDGKSTSLVVYFSATGTTRGVAEKIAALTGADLAEIIPAEPYTSEDLNYSDRSTRATVEQNTADARPEIANDISLDGYTTVYLGYPIWWGQAPRILSTFVEGHDFTGITVVPFCTSGGSGAGRTGETLGEQAKTGTFLTSTRLSAGVSDADLQTWIDSRT